MSNITICDICKHEIKGFFNGHIEFRYWHYDNTLIWPIVRENSHICFHCIEKIKSIIHEKRW